MIHTDHVMYLHFPLRDATKPSQMKADHSIVVFSNTECPAEDSASRWGCLQLTLSYSSHKQGDHAVPQAVSSSRKVQEHEIADCIEGDPGLTSIGMT